MATAAAQSHRSMDNFGSGGSDEFRSFGLRSGSDGAFDSLRSLGSGGIAMLPIPDPDTGSSGLSDTDMMTPGSSARMDLSGLASLLPTVDSDDLPSGDLRAKPTRSPRNNRRNATSAARPPSESTDAATAEARMEFGGIQLTEGACKKMHVCPYEGCNYSASGTGHLFRHVRVHTGEKPFVVRPPPSCLTTSIAARRVWHLNVCLRSVLGRAVTTRHRSPRILLRT
jgi:hypothetical protein